jgi:hypothetical protein
MATARKTSASIEATPTDERDELVAFTFRGVEFHALPSDEWGLDIIEAWENGKAVGTLRGVLGDDYEKLHALSPKGADLREFTADLWKALGGKGN